MIMVIASVVVAWLSTGSSSDVALPTADGVMGAIPCCFENMEKLYRHMYIFGLTYVCANWSIYTYHRCYG